MFGYGLKGSKDNQKNVVLKEVSLRGNICGEFVELSIKQVYENKGSENVDGVYFFPIPDTAVITGFEATLGGRTIKAAVEDKKEAVRIYDEALEKGVNILSLEQSNPEAFQFTIGQILPGETVKIKLSYMDRLIYENSSLKLVVPAILSPRHMDQESDTYMEGDANYKLSLNLLIEPLGKLNIQSPTHKIDVEWEEEINLAKVTFSPENLRLDRDFILLLKETNASEASGMIYKYDEGEETKGTLYLRLIPKIEMNVEDKPNHYIFLIDISESMEGEKLNQAKNAVQLCIRNLYEEDTFNIVAFGKTLKYFSEHGKVAFNDENLRKASTWIDALKPEEGAEIFEAIRYALSEKSISGYSTILLFTDDMIENETELLNFVRENIGDNRIYPFGIDTSANSFVINKLAEVGYGRPEFIYEKERIDDVVLRQFARIENPQVDITEINWGNMKVESTYPRTIDYLYDREPFSIFAKVSGEITGKITIKGKVGEADFIRSFDLDSLDLKENAELIQKVWSRKRIESIEERLKGERGSTAEAMVNKIVELSKESGIISPETSFIMLEQIEEPVLGMPIVHIIPLKISEETRKNIADANFLEVPSFMYKQTNMKNKGSDHNKTLEMKYPREEILRILAKNQFADGTFTNYSEKKQKCILKTTAMSVLAFTIGIEEISIYVNQLNKSIKYILKELNENKDLFDKKRYALAAVALKAAVDKGIIKSNLQEEALKAIEDLKPYISDKKFQNVNNILNSTIKESYKEIAMAFFDMSKDGSGVEEKIVILEEKESIDALARLAVLEALTL